MPASPLHRRLVTFLSLIAIGLQFCAAQDTASPENSWPMFGIYRLAEVGNTQAQKFTFFNLTTQKDISGACLRDGILLGLSSLRKATVTTHEIGAAPTTGVAFTFTTGAEKTLAATLPTTADEDLLVVFDGAPRALIGANELKRIVTEGNLFVAIMPKTREQFKSLEAAVAQLNKLLTDANSRSHRAK